MSNPKKTSVGYLPTDWQVLRADEFCKKVADGTHATPQRQKTGYPLVTSKHIRGSDINFEDTYLISSADYTQINQRSRVDQWDVLISMIGEYCGFVFLEKNRDISYAVKNVGIYKTGNEIKSKWLYYYLKSKIGKDQLSLRRSGTSQPYISLGALRELPLVVPSKTPEMKGAVGLLDSLDKRISNLYQQNYFLEKTITTMYKQWFFEFNYPGDKGKRTNSEIGEIPEGWEFCKIGKIIERVSERIGKDDQSKYAVLSAVKTGELILSGDYFSKQVFSKDLSKYIRLAKDDFAYNPARINIGSIGKVEDDIKGAVSPVYVAFRAKENFTNFVSLFIKTVRAKKHIELFANGSVRQSLSYDDFASMEIVKPSDDVLKLFNETYEAVFKKINANNQQIETLKKMLDTLLPKLMSGEVRVK